MITSAGVEFIDENGGGPGVRLRKCTLEANKASHQTHQWQSANATCGGLMEASRQDLIKTARRKLGYLDAAVDLNDLRSLPGNRLEALSGDRHGQHSIRVNDQFRVCFIWTDDGPKDVVIADYH